jgi:hypothetical protein
MAMDGIEGKRFINNKWHIDLTSVNINFENIS